MIGRPYRALSKAGDQRSLYVLDYSIWYKSANCLDVMFSHLIPDCGTALAISTVDNKFAPNLPCSKMVYLQQRLLPLELGPVGDSGVILRVLLVDIAGTGGLALLEAVDLLFGLLAVGLVVYNRDGRVSGTVWLNKVVDLPSTELLPSISLGLKAMAPRGMRVARRTRIQRMVNWTPPRYLRMVRGETFLASCLSAHFPRTAERTA